MRQFACIVACAAAATGLFASGAQTVQHETCGLPVVTRAGINTLQQSHQKDALMGDVISSMQTQLSASRVKARRQAQNGGVSEEIQVAYATDVLHEGLLTSMLSLSLGLPVPDRCAIHLIVPTAVVLQAGALCDCLSHELLSRNVSTPGCHVHEERTSYAAPFEDNNNLMNPRLSGHASAKSRFYLADYIPRAKRVLYLDTDTLVDGDVTTLFNIHMKYPLAAARQRNSATFRKIYMKHGQNQGLSGLLQDVDVPIFNSGVLLMDLSKWRSEAIARSLEGWVQHLSDKGDQLLLNLEFHTNRSFDALDSRWNIYNLGFSADKVKSHVVHDKPRILHWSGPNKPWDTLSTSCQQQHVYKSYAPMHQCRALSTTSVAA